VTQVIDTRDAAETEALAEQLAAGVAPGTLILLYGDLGAGKTAFVRGLAVGFGVDPDEVSSPTFTLVQEYTGRLTLQHVDLYRVHPGTEVEDLALDEFAARGDVVAVEWADRLVDIPPGAILVTLTDLGDTRRRIRVERP
jgi:tRNA threonylcarbamoyladenosine biosynthesis protein TsaE